MDVLVTGGCGFIGRATVDRLVAEGHRPVILDRWRGETQETRGWPAGAHVILGDVRDPNAVVEAMAHVDGFIHLAGVLGTQETIDNPLPAAETNILGGLNVLQAAAQYNLPGVNIGVGNWFEDNTYSLTKNTVERFTRMFAAYRSQRVTTVRTFNAYGPGQSVAAPYGASKVRKIIPSFVMRALTGDPIEIYGDGNQIMDMIHVDDVARSLVTALHQARNGHLPPAGPDGQVWHAGTGRPTTVNDIAAAVLAAVGGGHVRHLPMRPGETPGSVVQADPNRLVPGIYADDLTTLEVGLKPTVEYYARITARRAGR